MRPARHLTGPTIQRLFTERNALRHQRARCVLRSEERAIDAALRSLHVQLADQVDQFYDFDHVGPTAPLAPTRVPHHPSVVRCTRCEGSFRPEVSKAMELHATGDLFLLRVCPRTPLKCDTCGQKDTTRDGERLIEDRPVSTDAARLIATRLFQQGHDAQALLKELKRSGHPLSSEQLWEQLDALYASLLPRYMRLKDALLAEPILQLEQLRWETKRRARDEQHTLWRLSGQAGHFYQLTHRDSGGLRRVCEDFSERLVAHGAAVDALLAGDLTVDWACTPSALLLAFRRAHKDERGQAALCLLKTRPFTERTLTALQTLCAEPSTDAAFNHAVDRLARLSAPLQRGLGHVSLADVHQTPGTSRRRTQIKALMWSLFEAPPDRS